jgi:hypothetical protein
MISDDSDIEDGLGWEKQRVRYCDSLKQARANRCKYRNLIIFACLMGLQLIDWWFRLRVIAKEMNVIERGEEPDRF